MTSQGLDYGNDLNDRTEDDFSKETGADDDDDTINVLKSLILSSVTFNPETITGSEVEGEITRKIDLELFYTKKQTVNITMKNVVPDCANLRAQVLNKTSD